jgi:hypothetical protein
LMKATARWGGGEANHPHSFVLLPKDKDRL